MALPSTTTDILIIGAGPAGSTLARNLASHHNVTLVDPRPLDHPVAFPDKPCGGLISPSAQTCLLHMGLAIPSSLLVSPQAFGVRVIDLESGHTRLFQRDYINIARDRFDRWLFSLACGNRGVHPVLGKRLLHFSQHRGGIQATLDDGSEIEAKVIIGADGALSKVRHCLGNDMFGVCQSGAQPKKTQYGSASRCGNALRTILERSWFGSRRNLAVQQWFCMEEPPQEHGSYFHSKVTREYAWTIPKGGYLLVGTTMPWPVEKGHRAAVIRERMEILTEGLRQHGYRLGELHHTESCALLSPGLALSFPLGSGRALLAGEAAGLVSPSSAEGFSYAFKSAMNLALLLNEPGALTQNSSRLAQRYAEKLRPLLWNIRSKWLKSIVLCTPALRRSALACGVGSTRPGTFWK